MDEPSVLLCPECARELWLEVPAHNKQIGRAACGACGWHAEWRAFAALRPMRGKRGRNRRWRQDS